MKKTRPLQRMFTAIAVFALVNLTTAVAQNATTDPWETAIQAFERQDRETPPQPGRVLFLGSSSIRMWDLETWFSDLGAVNRGFGGSQIADSLRHFDRLVLPHRPRWIVFYAGDNDLAAGKSPEQVAQDFSAFAARTHKDCPDAKIAFIAIKPSVARWHLIEAVREANRRIQKHTEADDRLTFIDIDPPMIGADGKPRPELLRQDGLHLNDEGYRLWSQMVRRVVDEGSPSTD